MMQQPCQQCDKIILTEGLSSLPTDTVLCSDCASKTSHWEVSQL